MRKYFVMAAILLGAALGLESARAHSPQAPAGQPAFDPALLHPEKLTATAPETFTVRFSTTKGDFDVRVTRAWAPRGADRFYNLVQHGFYDQASFFRVVSGFMVQFGISAYPEVAQVWNNARIQDDPVKQSNKPRMISYATSGPNARTTQVFINYADNSNLDRQGFAPFGEVVAGMRVVEKLYSGYGDGPPGGHGPAQNVIMTQGKAYLDKDFPQLDSIKTAKIVNP
jgi:peptidyl-prolyl cis-trans isomerase A (cyclophilin A)